MLFETFLLFLLFLLSRTSYRGARAPKKNLIFIFNRTIFLTYQQVILGIYDHIPTYQRLFGNNKYLGPLSVFSDISHTITGLYILREFSPHHGNNILNLELINPIVFQIDFVKIKLYTQNGRLFPHLTSPQPEYRVGSSDLS